MAKKKKQKTTSRTQDSFTLPKSPDYTDPRQLERMIRKTFSQSVENLHRMEKDRPNLTVAMDMDAHRCKRRVQATITYVPRIRELVKDICPNIPDLFSVEEEWAYINALPTASYDMQQDGMYFSLGAAIWMLDRIKENGKIREAVRLLPRDDDSLEDVYIPDIYDPVHSEEVIRSMVYAIEHRNDDCLQPGQKKVKKNRSSDPLERVIVDSFTIQRQQHQDVPSRARFEALLSLIPPEQIKQAAEHFETKLFDWVECYYRCRAVYCEKQQALEQRRRRFMADVDIRMKEIDAKEKGPQMGILHKTENPLEQALLSGGPTTQGHFDLIASEPFQLMQYFETESQKLDDDLNLLSLEITRLAYHSHRFGSYPYKRIERDYGEKIADIVSGFTFCDPYKMCFALLYLMDSDSDLGLPVFYSRLPSVLLRHPQ